MNLASRLTPATEKGAILASDDAYRALAERFDCIDAGSWNIKGFTEPIRAWRLLGLRPAAQRPFVGRHGEIRRSAAALGAFWRENQVFSEGGVGPVTAACKARRALAMWCDDRVQVSQRAFWLGAGASDAEEVVGDDAKADPATQAQVRLSRARNA
jgi:hypothetical protein